MLNEKHGVTRTQYAPKVEIHLRETTRTITLLYTFTQFVLRVPPLVHLEERVPIPYKIDQGRQQPKVNHFGAALFVAGRHAGQASCEKKRQRSRRRLIFATHASSTDPRCEASIHETVCCVGHCV